MNQQEALQALLEGKRIRQANWLPGDYISHWKQTWVPDEQTGIPVYDPQSGILFYNAAEQTSGPISEEDAQKIFEVAVPWDLFDE